MEFWRRGLRPSSPLARGSGERCKLPSGVRGEAPVANAFYGMKNVRNVRCGYKFRHLKPRLEGSGGRPLSLLATPLYMNLIASNHSGRRRISRTERERERERERLTSGVAAIQDTCVQRQIRSMSHATQHAGSDTQLSTAHNR